MQLVAGLVLGAALGLLWAYARNIVPWARREVSSDQCAEVLDLLRDVAPRLRSLDEVFSEWPDAFGVLDEIVAQLTTNGGKTMADAVNRLDKAAVVSARAASVSADAAVESAKGAERLSRALGLIDAKLTLGVGAALRTEANVQDAADLAEGVARDLVTAQSVLEGVASDLAVDRVAVLGVATDLHDSHAEARRVGADAPSGAAADAGSRGKDPEHVSTTDSTGERLERT